MNIKIKKLTPELADDYVHFFDTTPHDDNIDEHKCYCVCWCNDDYHGKDFASVLIEEHMPYNMLEERIFKAI